MKWFRKAAEQNYADPQANLGAAYFNGEGVAQDFKEGVKWFRKAAEQNYAPAEYSLGQCYANGVGVAQDSAEAVRWFRKAAEQNRAEAQHTLGGCYHTGEGVAKDDVEAYKCFLLASGQGFEPAKTAVSQLEFTLTPAQIAEGKQRARNFEPREVSPAVNLTPDRAISPTPPEASGTGFFPR